LEKGDHIIVAVNYATILKHPGQSIAGFPFSMRFENSYALDLMIWTI
jgi:hypothetical protein